MDASPGVETAVHSLAALRRQTDLIRYDGPVLSLFENAEGEPYLFLWCDLDEVANRWLIARVTRERLVRYLDRRLSLRDLILSPADGYLFVADILADRTYRTVRIAAPEHLPSSYLPEADSFYEF